MSIFGRSPDPPASPFVGSTNTTTSFGTTNWTLNSPTSSPSGGLFGGNSAQTSTNLFGPPRSNVFGSPSTFGGTSGGNIFGTSPSGGIFGSTGGSTTTGGLWGSSSQGTSPFGTSSTTFGSNMQNNNNPGWTQSSTGFPIPSSPFGGPTDLTNASFGKLLLQAAMHADDMDQKEVNELASHHRRLGNIEKVTEQFVTQADQIVTNHEQRLQKIETFLNQLVLSQNVVSGRHSI